MGRLWTIDVGADDKPQPESAIILKIHVPLWVFLAQLTLPLFVFAVLVAEIKNVLSDMNELCGIDTGCDVVDVGACIHSAFSQSSPGHS